MAKSIPPKLAIITDDLTSSTDCGINLARSGLRTLVLLGEYKSSPEYRDADVISINTGTRGMLASKAYTVVNQAAKKIAADNYVNVYKSIDSTLRGNLGAEIDAVLDASNFEFAVVAPAFPFYGRTTVNGRHYLNGKPLAQTEFAHDPRSPIMEDNLIKLLSSQSKRKVGLIDLQVLRQGVNAVADRIDRLERDGVELLVFDAEVEEDLARIIGTVSKTDHRVLWVGSTGLSRYVSRIMTTGKPTTTKVDGIVSGARRLMCISGSAQETTRRQLHALKQLSGICSVQMHPLELVSTEKNARREIERCLSELMNGLRNGNDVVLEVASSKADVADAMAKGYEAGFDASQVSQKIVDALASVTEGILNSFELLGLILTGGDTAETICNRLGGVAIELLDEVEPGIPLGRLVGSGLFVVTKAGGFGTEEALINSLRLMQQI